MFRKIFCCFILIIHFQLIECKSLLNDTSNSELAPGINYEYVYVKGNNDSKGTILFLHGFPSSYYSWRHQIEYFSNKDYDCLAPKLMGYG